MTTKKKLLVSVVLLLPAFVIYTLFFIFPICNTFVLSFYKWSGMAQANRVFIGLKNYIALFSQPAFYHSLFNSFVFILTSLVIIFPISFSLAMIVNTKSRTSSVLRTVYYLPTLIPMAATGLMWMFMLYQNGGAVNTLLSFVGIHARPDWLGNTNLVIWSIALVNVWMFIGSNMLVFLTGLTGISDDILEAAVIDGAEGLKKVFYIIIPSMKETLKVFLTSAIAGSIQVFDIVYVMTDGGPGGASDVPATMQFNEAFLYNKFGYGSSIGVFILVTSLIITLILNYLLNDRDEKGDKTWIRI